MTSSRENSFSYAIKRIAYIPRRFVLAWSYYGKRVAGIFSWLFTSRETDNFTYELTEENLEYLAHLVSHVTGIGFQQARDYIDEANDNEELARHVVDSVSASEFRYRADQRCCFARRLGWYAFVRATKPSLVVETGVDKGQGSVLLAEAVLRNREEGHEGKYCGTDINPKAGWLLTGKYSKAGEIIYGDSIESLKTLTTPIDLFINDSDHSGEYEYQEYLTVKDKLSPSAIILGDNAHATGSLSRFSKETGRDFVFFKEVPKDHWYPGAGIGISFFSGDVNKS